MAAPLSVRPGHPHVYGAPVALPAGQVAVRSLATPPMTGRLPADAAATAAMLEPPRCWGASQAATASSSPPADLAQEVTADMAQARRVPWAGRLAEAG